MQRILPLSQQVIAKIAAGEVIERPVYAVKELVENALDAGADRITVQIEESGLKQIIVSDNGQGMSTEDLLESYKPHTTSKLRREEQLTAMQTLGFRGEALASIASISQMSIASRTQDVAVGTLVDITAGIVTKKVPFGMPQGTIVTVRHLFHTVPGRKKFLRSTRTEFRHIVEYMTGIALLYPQISFIFSHNGKVLFDLPKTKQVLERIPYLLGEKVFTSLIPLKIEEGTIMLSGFVTKPQAAVHTTHRQYLLLNNRSISDTHITAAIKDAYGSLLETNAQPTYIITVSMPSEFVDVNVHPRKETVRFVNKQVLYDTVSQAVKQTLGVHNSTTTWSDHLADDGGVYGDGKSWRVGKVDSYAGKLLKEKRVPWSLSTREEVGANNVLQLHKLYLVTQTASGMVFIDQHAAHERILYEQFLQSFKEKKKEQAQFILTKPLLIDMSFSESELVKEHVDLLQQAGFSIEHFRDNAFLVQSVPLLFQDRDVAALVSEMLADLWEEKRPKDIDRVSHRMIAYLACRGAVKSGDTLTKKHMKELIEKLEKTPNNATCPHGRPTRVEIGWEKVGKMFKRK